MNRYSALDRVALAVVARVEPAPDLVADGGAVAEKAMVGDPAAPPSVRAATIATPRNDENNTFRSRDNSSFTATECQRCCQAHPHRGAGPLVSSAGRS